MHGAFKVVTGGKFPCRTKGTVGGNDVKRAVLLLVSCLALSACGGAKSLHNFRNASSGPDEFSVQPAAPLQQPASLSDLPPPTPGAANLADPAPRQQALAALGARAQGSGIPASDGILVTHVSRNGVDPSIRATLAQEDAAFRKRRSSIRLPFLGGPRYFSLYARQALDAYAEADKFRAAGVKTPTAPPR